MIAQFLAHKPVNSASLTRDSFIASFSKLLVKALILDANTGNSKQLSGSEILPELRETGPRSLEWSIKLKIKL